MTIYFIEKRFYTENGKEMMEYYTMPYDLKGTIKAIGLLGVIKNFLKGDAYLTEGMAEFNTKYKC